MRCPRCYSEKRKDEETGEFPQMKIEGNKLVCSNCGYSLIL